MPSARRRKHPAGGPEGRASGSPPATEAVRIKLLGGFWVSVGSRTVEEGEWRLKKAASLVKLLALSSDHRLHRERAMDHLWPDLTPKAAANNLYQALHFARRALGAAQSNAASYVRLEGEQLRLCPGGQLWVDVDAFEEAAATARRTREPAAYRVAADLYAGELLPADRYEEWAEARREELRRSYVGLLLALAGIYENRGEIPLAIETLERAATEEPTHEEACGSLMRLYADGGQPFKALTQYDRLQEALRREPGRQPDAAIRHLYQQIVSGQRPGVEPTTAGLPPAHRPEPPRHNLPAARSTFVGREREILEVKRALSMTGLLTLTGPGGSGKTRLALEVARELMRVYPDGVWLAELASLTEGALVPQAVAAALGVREQPDRPIIDTLADNLRTRKLLLVLDNCEHLIDECARLAHALPGLCPGLRILATSREALDVAGEVTWLVRPLSVPDAGRLPSVEDVARHEAVRLFCERARLKLPAFELTRANAGAVAEVCRKLDGLPLAIELAATRMDVLTAKQTAERLDRALGLLTGGNRAADPRHRTLRATLDWSYELLGERERKLFARLSTFAGGWTLEAAEAVGAGDSIEEGDVTELFLVLVDKSLVVAESDGKDAFRYAMLEPVHQYARERLATSSEADAVRRRHAEFFLALAEEAEPELTGSRQVQWLNRLETEHDNFRALLSWTVDHDEGELMLRLVGALWRFWHMHGHLTEGQRWVTLALSEGGAALPPVRAKVLGGAGLLARARGENELAETCLKESLALARRLEDDALVASSLNNLGALAQEQGDYGRATALRKESLALYRKSGNTFGVAMSQNDLGDLALTQGDYERATRHFEETLVLTRELGVKWVEAVTLLNLGNAALAQGDYERAALPLKESVALSREVGDMENVVYSLQGLAGVAAAGRNAERAARLFGAAEALRETIAASTPPFERSLYERHLAATRAEMEEASWEAAWAEGQNLMPEEAIEYALRTYEPVSPTTSIPRQPPAGALTRREREVAVLVARGLTNRQIARELTISDRTAETHIGRILRKLQLPSRSRLAAWVVEQQPSPPDNAEQARSTLE